MLWSCVTLFLRYCSYMERQTTTCFNAHRAKSAKGKPEGFSMSYFLPTFTTTQKRNAIDCETAGKTVAYEYFGECCRFKASLVASRLKGFAEIFITDADVVDEVTGLPAVVAQLPMDATAWNGRV